MRNDLWLTNRLIYIWKTHFSDIEDGNEIKVRFGRHNRTRLGSIAIREKDKENRRILKNKLKYLEPHQVVSIITINGYFQNPDIPEKIVDAILAHEFCHFVYGFNSMRKRNHRYPHAGGIIDKELTRRGLGEDIKFQKKWIKENWKNTVGL